MIIRTFILKIFKIELVGLSLEIVYKRNNVYYPTLSKAIFEIKDNKFNENIKKRLKLGESRWFAEVVGKGFVEGLRIGLEGKKLC